MIRPLRPALVVLTSTLAVSACGGSTPRQVAAASSPVDPATVDAGPVAVHAARIRSVDATVLVDGAGYALYLFVPDHRDAVTCADDCALTWPPLEVPSARSRPAVGGGVEPGLLGTDPGAGAAHVVTYDGWPLYTYVGDVRPGEASGQDIDLNGGLWLLMRPDGIPLVPAGQPAP